MPRAGRGSYVGALGLTQTGDATGAIDSALAKETADERRDGRRHEAEQPNGDHQRRQADLEHTKLRGGGVGKEGKARHRVEETGSLHVDAGLVVSRRAPPRKGWRTTPDERGFSTLLLLTTV